MNVLVVGAGAVGGYFGGRLLQAGRDVRFLVRPQRAERLRATGLTIRSPRGDAFVASPPTVTADALDSPAGAILVSCKAYDLPGAIEAFAPAVGPSTAIVPLLNGIAHLETLQRRFAGERVLGAWCFISSTLDEEGRVVHFGDAHELAFGELDGSRTSRVRDLAALFSNAGFDERASDRILREMWEKWIFIAAAAGIACLMRATVGDIAAAGASNLASSLLDECAATATPEGFAPSEPAMSRYRDVLTMPGSTLAPSMLRDIERGARTEADHVVGDLLRRANERGIAVSLLPIAYAHLKAFEARRRREATSSS